VKRILDENPAKKHLLLLVLIFGLLLASFVTGCQPETKSTPKVELLPEAQTEPAPSPIVEPSPTPSLINVRSVTTQADFPQSLTFNLEVESNSEITDIELRYKIKKVTMAVVTTTIKPDFTPANRVGTSWIWDTRKASLPPGAEIEYSWVIKNATGDRLKTEPARLIFDDSRYQWQELVMGKVRLFWHQGDQSFGQQLMDAAQAALGKLARDTGAELEKQAKIYVYADSQDLHGALVFPQEWTGGVAFPEYGVIAIGISPSNLAWGKRTVAHELAHMVIHQVTFNPYSDLPTWLDEGLAMYAEGDLRKDLEGMLTQAISANTLFSVRSLGSGFPAEFKDAGLAYAESYSLVKFLIDNYGSEKMLNLLQVFKQGSGYDDALLTVYGFDIDGLDDLWRASFGLRYRPVTWFQTSLLDLALAFTVVYSPKAAGLA